MFRDWSESRKGEEAEDVNNPEIDSGWTSMKICQEIGQVCQCWEVALGCLMIVRQDACALLCFKTLDREGQER